MKKFLALILSLVVIATALFSLSGCDIVLDDCNHKYDGTTCIHCGVINPSLFQYTIGWRDFSCGIAGFKNKSDLPSKIVIPKTYYGMEITYINVSAFETCENLTTVIIQENITAIKPRAFAGCTSLQYIVIPDSVTDIGFAVFSGCTSLTEIVIPNNVTFISNYTFVNCANLESIVIPKSVTSIGEGVFMACDSLSDIYFTGTEEEWNAIDIASYGNESLENATIHFNYIPKN